MACATVGSTIIVSPTADANRFNSLPKASSAPGGPNHPLNSVFHPRPQNVPFCASLLKIMCPTLAEECRNTDDQLVKCFSGSLIKHGRNHVEGLHVLIQTNRLPFNHQVFPNIRVLVGFETRPAVREQANGAPPAPIVIA